MMGDNMKEAYKAIRKALKHDDAAIQFNSLRMFCLDQAHRLDHDSQCIGCSKWLSDDEDRVYDVDGILCVRCGHES